MKSSLKRLTEDNMIEVKRWCRGEFVPDYEKQDYYLAISTPEGLMTAVTGDYIIQDFRGNFYVCDGDIFEKVYLREWA